MTGEVGIITPDLCSKLPHFEKRWKVREDAEEMKPAAVTAWERASQPVLDRLKGSELRRHERFIKQCFGDVCQTSNDLRSSTPITYLDEERYRQNYLLDHLRAGWLVRQSPVGGVEMAQEYINSRRRALGQQAKNPFSTLSTTVPLDGEGSGRKQGSNKRKAPSGHASSSGQEVYTFTKNGIYLRTVILKKQVDEQTWDTVIIGKKRKSIPATRIPVTACKPGPPVAPLVWADSRQELCESLPYYRAFQSGLYMNKGVAYGYLLDGFDSPRDIWAQDGKVIISHGGGNAKTIIIRGESDQPAQKVTVLQDDQDGKDNRISTLVNAANNRRPIVLIAGNRYKQLPWSLGTAAYAVLGWYLITHSWVEAEFLPSPVREHGERPYRHRHKFRFDWCPGQGEPWFSRPYSNPSGWKPADQPAETTPFPQAVPMQTTASSTEVVSAGGHILRRRTRTKPVGEEGMRRFGKLKRPKLAIVSSHSLTPKAGSEAGAVEAMPTWRQQACKSCRRSSPTIYKAGWFCLHDSCRSFWRVPVEGKMQLVDPESALRYRRGFLRHSTLPTDTSMLPFELVPPHPEAAYIGLRSAWKGLCCPRCGKLSSRENWRAWSCRACHWSFEASAVNFTPIPGDDVSLDSSAGLVGHFGSGRSFPVSLELAPGTDVLSTKYTLPDNAGAVYHVSSVCRRPMADEMFRKLQLAANDTCEFQRHPLKATKMTGRLLAQQYSLNIGADYKYTAETVTIPFERAPAVFYDALSYITEMTLAAIPGDHHVAFNECLAVLYRDGQGMAYHDDGEPGLGPLVAGLSLGSDAKMSFRRKKSCRRAERKAAGGISGMAAEDGRAEILTSDLDVIVRHGDVLIMQGRKMQDLYEHRVVPTGLRAACTFRHITPAHLLGKKGGEKGVVDVFASSKPIVEGLDNEFVASHVNTTGGQMGCSMYRDISPEEVDVDGLR